MRVGVVTNDNVAATRINERHQKVIDSLSFPCVEQQQMLEQTPPNAATQPSLPRASLPPSTPSCALRTASNPLGRSSSNTRWLKQRELVCLLAGWLVRWLLVWLVDWLRVCT